jgi:copper transport protein
VVLALTAALVQTTPGRTSQAAREAAAGPPSYTLASQLYSLQVELDPGGTGENTLHLYAYTPVGAPIAIKEWRVTAGMPAAGVEPLPVSMLPISDNHAVGEVSLPRAGAWEFRFTLRTTDIDEASVVQVITVR